MRKQLIEKIDGQDVVIDSIDDFRDAPDGHFFHI